MREAADHSCLESHQAVNVSLNHTPEGEQILPLALLVLGVHTAGVIVWSELRADNTLTLFEVYKFWAFLLKKQTNKVNHTDYFHLLHLKEWSASKISLTQGENFQTMKFCSWCFKLWIWQSMSSNSSVEVSRPPNMHFLPECHWNAFILVPTSPCHRVNRNGLWWNLRPVPKRTATCIPMCP